MKPGHLILAINCGMPENLFESELFGHIRGTFAGAARDHNVLLAAANGTTEFRDEMGDMPIPLQLKLLRVLQERTVRPGKALWVVLNACI